MSQTSRFTRARQLPRVLRQLPAVLTADTALARPTVYVTAGNLADTGGTN